MGSDSSMLGARGWAGTHEILPQRRKPRHWREDGLAAKSTAYSCIRSKSQRPHGTETLVPGNPVPSSGLKGTHKQVTYTDLHKHTIYFSKNYFSLNVVVHIFNSSAQGAMAGGSP